MRFRLTLDAQAAICSLDKIQKKFISKSEIQILQRFYVEVVENKDGTFAPTSGVNNVKIWNSIVSLV